MITTRKILAALVLIGAIFLGSRHLLKPQPELASYYTLEITGEITAQAFLDARKHLLGVETDIKKVVITSGGGDGPAALAIAMLIHEHNWDVEVGEYCISSCAIFIFPAGNKKYLNDNSLLMFHGGPYQENLLEMASQFDQDVANKGSPSTALVLGRKDKEGYISFTPGEESPAAEEVLEILSMKKDSTAVEWLHGFRNASDRFYEKLGVNPLIATYGQIGSYEPLYKSYDYSGFIYGVDSLRRLGIVNIELKNGQWHPERNPIFKEAYEVTYP